MRCGITGLQIGNHREPERRAHFAGAVPFTTVARVPPFSIVEFITPLFAQFGFKNLLDRLGGHPGKDPILAGEVVDAFGLGQLAG